MSVRVTASWLGRDRPDLRTVGHAGSPTRSRRAGSGSLIQRLLEEQQEIVEDDPHRLGAGRLDLRERPLAVIDQLVFRRADALRLRLAGGPDLVANGLEGRLGVDPRRMESGRVGGVAQPVQGPARAEIGVEREYGRVRGGPRGRRGAAPAEALARLDVVG